jgi:hypothetical protein
VNFFNLFNNKKNHIHNFKDKLFSTEVTTYAVISIERCECGLERIKRVYYQGKNAGEVKFEYIETH